MKVSRALWLGAVATLPMGLGGCVAAVAAIPALAGGAVAATGGDGIDNNGAAYEGSELPPPPFERPAPEPATAPQPLEADQAEPENLLPPSSTTAVPEPKPSARKPIELVPAPTVAPQAAEPEVALAIPARPASSQGVGTQLVIDPSDSDYGGFFDTAMAQATINPLTDNRSSAILRTSLNVDLQMTECGMLQPVVLIDLDPAGGVFSPNSNVVANPELATALELLRKRDVGIFWISDAPVTSANTIRARLVSSGLDPAAGDSLLLSYGDEDRKQLRREGLARSHCVIAIAGDSKSDFDELYDYLKYPEAGEPFDALIGRSWFLTPQPLRTEMTGDTE